MVQHKHINRRTQWDHVEIIVILFKKDLKATLIILNVVLHLNCFFSNRKVAVSAQKNSVYTGPCGYGAIVTV